MLLKKTYFHRCSWRLDEGTMKWMFPSFDQILQQTLYKAPHLMPILGSEKKRVSQNNHTIRGLWDYTKQGYRKIVWQRIALITVK